MPQMQKWKQEKGMQLKKYQYREHYKQKGGGGGGGGEDEISFHGNLGKRHRCGGKTSTIFTPFTTKKNCIWAWDYLLPTNRLSMPMEVVYTIAEANKGSIFLVSLCLYLLKIKKAKWYPPLRKTHQLTKSK